MSHRMKIREKFMEKRTKSETSISETSFVLYQKFRQWSHFFVLDN